MITSTVYLFISVVFFLTISLNSWLTIKDRVLFLLYLFIPLLVIAIIESSLRKFLRKDGFVHYIIGAFVLVYTLLLPELKINTYFLSNLLFSRKIGYLVVFICAALVIAFFISRFKYISYVLGVVASLIVIRGLLFPYVTQTERVSEVHFEVESRVPVRTILLVSDGLDPHLLFNLALSGELTFIRSLLQNATYGELTTVYPALSAAVWSSMATGVTPDKHGIEHFIFFDLPGLQSHISSFPLHVGLNFFVVPFIKMIFKQEIVRLSNLENSLYPPFWEIVGSTRSYAVVKWLLTNRTIITNFHLNLETENYDVYKYRLNDLSSKSAISDKCRDFLSSYEEDLLWQVFLTGDYDLLATEFVSVDKFHHYCGRDYRRGIKEPIIKRYKDFERFLKEVVEGLSNVAVIVVSDHGFDFDNLHHISAPPGVFLAVGPPFKKGNVTLSILDLNPLILYLQGYPVPKKNGKGFLSVINDHFIKKYPPRFIDSYPLRVKTEKSNKYLDESTLKVLKSLGYLP